MKRFLFAFITLFASTSAFAQSDELVAEATDFALNNTLYVLYHEAGHLLIGEFGIPVLGKEEDAADNLATIRLLEDQDESSDNVLIDSADGWFLSDELTAGESFEDAHFYGSHSLDLQRAFGLVCLMVGSSPEVFGEVATAAGMDGDRQEECADDYIQTQDSWRVTLASFARTGDAQRVAINYAPSENFADAAELMEEVGLLERVVIDILDNYALPRPVEIESRECGEANAFYDPSVGQIVLCYELVENFYDMYIAAYSEAAN